MVYITDPEKGRYLLFAAALMPSLDQPSLLLLRPNVSIRFISRVRGLRRSIHRLGIFSRDHAGSILGRIHSGKFGAKKKDQGRVIDPNKNRNQRTGGAEGRADAARPDIESDKILPYGEQY